MRIRLAITPGGPRHDAAIPWWRVEYRRGGREWFEYVEAWTRDEAAAEVGGAGVSVLRVERVGAPRAGGGRS